MSKMNKELDLNMSPWLFNLFVLLFYNCCSTLLYSTTRTTEDNRPQKARKDNKSKGRNKEERHKTGSRRRCGG